MTQYEQRILNRSFLRYLIGLIVRWRANHRYEKVRRIARKRGALIGENVVMPMELARIANKNLTIGNNVSIQTADIDLRSPVKIGNNVIIGKDVKILTASHNIDSTEWEFKSYGLEIEDYVWIATNAIIMPSCRKLSYGCVVGGASCVVKNTTPMEVYGGNPARSLRKRSVVHSNLVVESLLGGDYEHYKEVWKSRRQEQISEFNDDTD